MTAGSPGPWVEAFFPNDIPADLPGTVGPGEFPDTIHDPVFDPEVPIIRESWDTVAWRTGNFF